MSWGTPVRDLIARSAQIGTASDASRRIALYTLSRKWERSTQSALPGRQPSAVTHMRLAQYCGALAASLLLLSVLTPGSASIVLPAEYSPLGNDKDIWFVNVSVGTPPQRLPVQIDTGECDVPILSHLHRALSGVFPAALSTSYIFSSVYDRSRCAPNDALLLPVICTACQLAAHVALAVGSSDLLIYDIDCKDCKTEHAFDHTKSKTFARIKCDDELCGGSHRDKLYVPFECAHTLVSANVLSV